MCIRDRPETTRFFIGSSKKLASFAGGWLKTRPIYLKSTSFLREPEIWIGNYPRGARRSTPSLREFRGFLAQIEK